MQPRLGLAPFNSQDFIFEVKWDGVRALVAKDEQGLRITDRHGADLLARLPELAPVARQLPDGVLVDAEIVTCDRKGRPRYELLAGRLGPKARQSGHGPLVLAFDLLYAAYRPLFERPLVERRERLVRLVLPGGPLLVPEYLESDGEPFYEAVLEFGLEGIVAKRKDAPYVPGARSGDWLKVHSVPRMDVVVCGAVLADALPASLICGAYRDHALTYVGRARVPAFLREHASQQLAGLLTATSPLEGPVDMPAGARWLQPERCAIVEHSGPPGRLAEDARLRSFRVDGRPSDCRIEDGIRMPSGMPRLESGRPRLVVLRSLFPAGGA